MKCPKCGYIGFEQADKCRNCGYDFSLVHDPALDLDLPLKRDAPLSPPADFDFRTGDTPASIEPVPSRHPDFALPLPSPTPPGPLSELPLFQVAASASAPAAGAGARAVPRPATRTPPPFAPVRPEPSGGAGSASASHRSVSLGGASSAPTPRPSVVAPATIAPPAASSRPTPPPKERAAAPRRVVPAQARSRPTPAVLDFREAEADAPETVASRPPRSRPTTASDARSAGPLARALAAIVDATILLGLNAGVLYFTLRVCRLPYADILRVPFAPLVAFFLLLDGGYLIAFTVVGGQTIGKMAASLKVVSEDGERVVLGQAIVRAIGYFASALPAGLGFVPGLFGPSRRALHDRLANTRVVRL